MAKKKFSIPDDNMLDFVTQLLESELKNEITEIDDNDCIVISVYYNPNDRNQLFELMAWYEDNISEDDDD